MEPGSFVDSHYRHTESDLLFSVNVAGTDGLLYLLFEHQITNEPTLALRLLRYMVRIWEDRLKRQPAPASLPVILPIVLAQNAEVWELSPRFASLLDLPAGCEEALAPFVPDFTFRLIQLAAVPFEAIRGSPAGIMTLRVMKAERVAQLLTDPVWDEALLIQLARATLELLIRYLLQADIDKEAFDRKVNSVTQPELQNDAMSLAEQLRQEGLRKGRQEGRQEGIQEDILEVLEIRFEQLPAGLREAITAIHDPAHLRRLHKASIQAVSLEGFSRSL